jgi:proteasome lid subunit RPN8/RPN11
MESTTFKAIAAHAESMYPRECCGLVIVSNGREQYVQCRNTAVGNEHFILPAEDYAEAESHGEIIAVVHSHPDVPAAPSQADKVSCEASGLAWHIIRVDVVGGAPTAGELATFEPNGYAAPLVGRVFSHGVLDCYQLIVDWYRQERSVVLKYFSRGDNWWNDGSSDLYTTGFSEAGFVKIKDGEQPLVGDVILMQIRSNNGVPNHAGIYIGDGKLLHHLYGRLSSRDIYGGYYQDVTRAILRYHN